MINGIIREAGEMTREQKMLLGQALAAWWHSVHVDTVEPEEDDPPVSEDDDS